MINYNALSKVKPKEDGNYLVLKKGFTFDIGNSDDLRPIIGHWNGGRGCFNEDYGNKNCMYWMEIPEIGMV